MPTTQSLPGPSGVQAADSDPGARSKNDLWFDTDDGVIYHFNGSAWVNIGYVANDYARFG